MGALVVQLAHILGAEVTTTIRSDTADLVRELGADHVIDTRTADFGGQGAVYDVVVDTVGGAALASSFAVVRPGGRLVTLSAPPPASKADEYGIEATFFIVTPDRTQLGELAGLVDTGRLQVAIADTFPLTQGQDAFESGRRPHRRAGKTVRVVRH